MGIFEGMEGKGKTEPDAAMREVANTMWQMYVALKDAGFSKADAMTMVRETMTTMIAATVNIDEKNEGQ